MIRIKRQILVVSNDLAVCQELQESFQNNITDTYCMTSSAEALASYIKQDYCLVILDTQLSDMDSVGMLQTMRGSKHTPILLLIDSLQNNKIVEFLHAGADTYIEKPVNIEICVAQATALIQRYVDDGINNEQHKPIVHGSDLIISPRYRQVMVNGKSLSLTRKEFDLLHCMASYPNQVFSCEQLYNHVWNDESAVAVDEVVKSQIKRLRKKLTSIGKDYIQNEWGVGYKFVLPKCKTEI